MYYYYSVLYSAYTSYNVKNQWKINNLISTSTFTSIECNIKTLNIFELKNIKNILKSSTLINEIILKTISLNSNSYFINYYGNEFMLINYILMIKIIWNDMGFN